MSSNATPRSADHPVPRPPRLPRDARLPSDADGFFAAHKQYEEQWYAWSGAVLERIYEREGIGSEQACRLFLLALELWSGLWWKHCHGQPLRTTTAAQLLHWCEFQRRDLAKLANARGWNRNLREANAALAAMTDVLHKFAEGDDSQSERMGRLLSLPLWEEPDEGGTAEVRRQLADSAWNHMRAVGRLMEKTWPEGPPSDASTDDGLQRALDRVETWALEHTSSAKPPVEEGSAPEEDVAGLEAMREAIRGATGCETTKPEILIKAAGIGKQRARRALRELESRGEYQGFTRRPPRR